MTLTSRMATTTLLNTVNPCANELIMKKRVFCICENKGPDQQGGKLAADQRFCFYYKDSAIPLLLKHVISSL